MAELSKIVKFLNAELKVDEFEDSSNNGLQVENSGAVKRICCGVDASMEFMEEAEKRGADMVLCHHGISWGDSLKRITEMNYWRVGFLIRNDIALYACHLPLDAHPKLGNNVQLCKALGVKGLKRFGFYNGKEIGYSGSLAKPMRYDRFKKHVEKVTGNSLQTLDFGKKTIKTVAVVSGGASGEMPQAGEQGVDVYVTGESTLASYAVAQEYGMNAIFAGHYATEVYGVRALVEVVKKKFGVQAEFIDLGITL
jgi:dinuclear metal center YbgI/SA1388 family protein